MMAGQTVRPIKLREGDMLTDFEKLFNEFIAFYQSRTPAAAPVSAKSREAAAESQLVSSNAD